MNLLRYSLLALTIWNLPTFLLDVFGDLAGSYSSYLMFGLLLVYYFFVTKNSPILLLITLGISYFVISGLVYVDDFENYGFKFLKYLIFILAGAEIVRRTTKNEVYVFLLIGSLSIIINAVLFQDDYGRYSGFYLNPNAAGLVSLVGYCFSFIIDSKKLKLIGIFIFTFAGLLTLSRYFIIMWIVLTLISIYADKKNAVIFGIGFGTLFILLSIATFLQLNALRFSVIQDVFGNQISRGLLFLQENSRIGTWALYYDQILDKPFFGNGFLTFTGIDKAKQGVHNSFLLTVGEAGILPFIIMIIIYAQLLFKSLKEIKITTYFGLLILSIITYMLVSHNYYDNYVILFFSIWLFIRLTEDRIEQERSFELLT